MSEQVPPSTQDSARPWRYSGVQVAMLVLGVILLLPGLCSLVFMIGMMPDLLRGDPIVRAIAMVWVACFFLSAAGIALIYVARKRARAVAANRPGPDPKP